MASTKDQIDSLRDELDYLKKELIRLRDNFADHVRLVHAHDDDRPVRAFACDPERYPRKG